MARFGIVNNETKKCVNVVLWDGAEWLPPANHIIVQHDGAEIGHIYDTDKNTFRNVDNV